MKNLIRSLLGISDLFLVFGYDHSLCLQCDKLEIEYFIFDDSIWLQLLRIEEELRDVRFAGEAFRSP